MKKKVSYQLTYDQQYSKCKEFIQNFISYCPHSQVGSEHQYEKKYLLKLQQIANHELSVIEILYEDLQQYFRKEEEKTIVKGFRYNTKRYVSIFSDIAQKLMPLRDKPKDPDQEFRRKFQTILIQQRIQNLDISLSENQSERIPSKMKKNFQVYIVFGANKRCSIQSISQIRSSQIGSLIACKAIITKVSQIKPQLILATYVCNLCGCENYLQVQNHHFKHLHQCVSRKCRENKVNGQLTFITEHSQFESFQQAKIQQTSCQLQNGNIPHTMTLHFKNHNCQQASPGDVVIIQGVLLPFRKNVRQLNSLNFSLYIEVYKVTKQKKKYVEMSITEQKIHEIQKIRKTMNDQQIFQKLANSISPQIYGLSNIKRALLLMMTGGVTKQTHDNLKIRGQINVALIGDPGIAKSQLLKQVSSIAPRGVYTTGKGSSGVGLTASITSDPESHEIYLQAGPIVLADMGICCIDQFDKMSENDKISIHEAMQQQTVSITKAGISTSLKARTSILAAANPLYGRYNKKESVHKNINLSLSLTSRFDLIFIILDRINPQIDLELAMHIGKVHQNRKSPTQSDLFDVEFLRSYIALSKKYNPIIPEQLHSEMIQKYIIDRKQESLGLKDKGSTTVRALLSLIRLCQARARLRFSNEVNHQDIKQCIQLLQDSQKIEKDKEEELEKGKIRKIFGIIRSICNINGQIFTVSVQKVRKRVIRKGYSEEDFKKTLTSYHHLNIIMIKDQKITLLP